MKKSLVVLLTFSLMAVSLSGCGAKSITGTSSKPVSKTSSVSAKSNTSKSSGTDTAASDNSGAEEVVLKVFDSHAYGLDEYAEMVKAFE